MTALRGRIQYFVALLPFLIYAGVTAVRFMVIRLRRIALDNMAVE